MFLTTLKVWSKLRIWKVSPKPRKGLPAPPPPPIFCSTRCGPEHGHCVFFIYFHIWKKFYLKYITKMLSSFFRYYKMLVSLGLHEYIYNVLHMNTRYNSEVFNLYYKNIIQYRITKWNILSYVYDTKFQNFAFQSYYKNIYFTRIY